jgi:site-specific recombinase XerD
MQMGTGAVLDSYGSAGETLYASGMAITELVGIESARKYFALRLQLAKDEERHTVVTKHGVPEGVLVDMKWYREARKALGQPTDL